MKHNTFNKPATISKTEFKNSLAVAPMTRVSSDPYGMITKQVEDYYMSYANGGFGLVITEGLYTDKAFSQTYRNQPGLTSPEQANSWRGLIKRSETVGTKIIAQLMHGGALSQFNKYKPISIAPSAVKPKGQQMTFYYGEGDYSVPREITKKEIEQVIYGYVHAATLAQKAGFSGVEIHGANGYLLDQFLTKYTNQRQDEYGGSVENRLKLIIQILEGIKTVTSPGFIVGVRFSQSKVNDYEYRWDSEDEAEYIFEQVKKCGADYLHITEYDVTRPMIEGRERTMGEIAAKATNLPIIVNGGAHTAEQVEKAFNVTGADLISLGKTALANPDWPNRVLNQQKLSDFNFAMFEPLADLNSQQAYLDNSAG